MRSRSWAPSPGVSAADVANVDLSPEAGDVPADKIEVEHVDGGPEVGDPSGASPRGVLVASEAGLAIRQSTDVMDVIAAAYDADALILTADDVEASFVDLRTGLAGELFQKATQCCGPGAAD